MEQQRLLISSPQIGLPIDGNFIIGSLGKKGQQVQGNFSDKKIYTFENKASGIILIKQDYKRLFYNPSQKLKFPIEEIEIKFYDKKNTDEEVLKLVFNNQMIAIQSTQLKESKNEIKKVIIRGVNDKLGEILFPPTPEDAPLMLQKKIWIELNRLNRTLMVYSGDVVNVGQEPLLKKKFDATYSSSRQGWDKEADKFEVPNYLINQNKKPLKMVEPFTEIKYFQVNFKIKQSQLDKSQKRKINDFVTLQILKLGRIHNPVLNENVSLLKPSQATLEEMPTPLRYLFDCLKNLNIRYLPDFQASQMKQSERNQYLNWNELQFALHHSLVSSHCYAVDSRPLGILNHLYKMKLKKKYSEFKFTKQQGEMTAFLSKEQILTDIYQNRSGYIRLELLPHEGLGPGSMAVLQVWPPFHCSSIHNHGDAFGLIKVLSGSIRVQNFQQLAFAALVDKPYLQSDYYEDQYTWLSELSFGIHRLINVKHQTCITLQSYYHNEVTAEFFSVVRKVGDKNVYIEYYPQNDWVNYLNWQPDRNNTLEKEDRQFIDRVIKHYDLRKSDKTVDTSFQKLALILKKQYEYMKNYLSV